MTKKQAKALKARVTRYLLGHNFNRTEVLSDYIMNLWMGLVTSEVKLAEKRTEKRVQKELTKCTQ